MNIGDSIAAVIGAAMALILAMRAMQAKRVPSKTLWGMAVVWVLLIAGVALVAANWPQ